jgi:hypothetical protein
MIGHNYRQTFFRSSGEHNGLGKTGGTIQEDDSEDWSIVINGNTPEVTIASRPLTATGEECYRRRAAGEQEHLEGVSEDK